MISNYATCRSLGSFIAIGILSLCLLQRDKVRADEIVEAQGLLAMPVSFDNAAARKLSAAAGILLDHCTVGQPATTSEWLQAQRLCHLRIKYRDAHRIALGKSLAKVVGQESLAVDELIVTLPLPTSGRVYTRSGDEYHWFAKWPGTETNRLCNPIQALLSSYAHSSADASGLIEKPFESHGGGWSRRGAVRANGFCAARPAWAGHPMPKMQCVARTRSKHDAADYFAVSTAACGAAVAKGASLRTCTRTGGEH